MADAKPVDKKDSKDSKDSKKPTSSSIISWEEVILLILAIVALLFVFIPRFFGHQALNSDGTTQVSTKGFNIKDTYNKLFNSQEQQVLDNQGHVIETTKTPSLIEEDKYKLIDFLKILGTVIFSTLIFIMIFLYLVIYYNKFRRELIIKNYKKRFETVDEIKQERIIEKNNQSVLEKLKPDTNGIINPRWELVGKYYNSANQSDWKLAIIEADIMLYDVLNKSGFVGNSIGEMLKNTDRSKLHTLDEAWSSHKVRNEISHSGSEYVLSRNMVEKVIAGYERVFDELNYI